MKSAQYYILIVLTTACIVLSIAAIVVGNSNQQLQEELQRQQTQINRGTTMQQVGTNIVRDIAQLSVEDAELRQLLTKHGFNVQVAQPTPAASPAEAPAPKPRF
jgi:hypothetical protein